jgi:N-acetylglutamate synthase-like GNAT family acetyltransferase
MMTTDTATAAAMDAPVPAVHARAELRVATAADARAIHRLVTAHLAEGHLLPRTLDELTARAPRFLVAERGGVIAACAELAPLGSGTAEVRSLVVHRDARQEGLGRRLVQALATRARIEGFTRLCAFTHEPGYFVRKGFSIVPHAWVPEKIATDCHRCPLFRSCGQHAVELSLAAGG